jgi:hypothetical protein
MRRDIDQIIERLKALGVTTLVVHGDTLHDETAAAIRFFLLRAFDNGKLRFAGRFDRGVDGDYAFTLEHGDLKPYFGPQPASRPFGSLDEPKMDSDVRGPVRVMGWALAPSGIRRVRVFVHNREWHYDAQLFPRPDVAAQSRGLQAPVFEVDPFWPKPLPNHWVLGAAVGVWVDAEDHVWMVHRGNNPDTIKGLETNPPFSEICCATAPRVLEFDQAGNLLRHWGPGPSDPWMDAEHGITVDHKNNVWLGGGAGGDAQVLKYTKDGRFVLQIGRKGARARAGAARPINDANSPDMESFGQPTKIVVDLSKRR